MLITSLLSSDLDSESGLENSLLLDIGEEEILCVSMKISNIQV